MEQPDINALVKQMLERELGAVSLSCDANAFRMDGDGVDLAAHETVWIFIVRQPIATKVHEMIEKELQA